jgi:hypothetical protein
MENNKSKYTFKTHFLTFVSQAITGVLFPYYTKITSNGKFISNSKSYCINQFHDLNIIPVLYVDYINECWDKYNSRQNDEIEEDEYDYVLVKLDKIKKYGNFKHNYCLFDLWWNFSFQILILVLARIDENMMSDFDTFKININEMIDSLINLILVIKDENRQSFIDFVSSTRDILLNPLIDLYKYKYKNEANTAYEEYMNNRYDKFKILLEEINKKRNEYIEEKNKKQGDIEYLDDEFLCSICYTQIANYNIIPCSHKGCKECLLAYMADNDKCFMCRQPFDSVVKISDEEIQKKIEESKATDKGDKENQEEV